MTEKQKKVLVIAFEELAVPLAELLARKNKEVHVIYSSKKGIPRDFDSYLVHLGDVAYNDVLLLRKDLPNAEIIAISGGDLPKSLGLLLIFGQLSE